MLVKNLFAGFGGQGVLMMGYTVAYTAMMEDRHVTYMPSYGAEVRGGTANCTVTISDEEIASPIASSPDVLLVMNEPSLDRFENSIKLGGMLLINSTMCQRKPMREDIETYTLPAASIAEELGNLRTTNMVVVGAFTRVSGVISMDALMASIEDIVGQKRRHMLDINRKALRAGYDFFDRKPKKPRKRRAAKKK